ncbi:HNH endonuclease [Bacillus siamensis]|uniref:ABC-three component system protein n=1 Tax=Bacillus siamensis TaxID=659243 RepID=UPI002E22B194|nr:HNH endonuclease [Bacillus siamensis]MED5095415.1 HNH endonuclease [Bacillus siamensis]
MSNRTKVCEVAHIYPLNPTEYEKNLLIEEVKPFVNPNEESNLILLCNNCHEKYDKKKTKQTYREMVELKSSILKQRHNQNLCRQDLVEEEINLIVNRITDLSLESIEQDLAYDVLNLNQKSNGTLKAITKTRINMNISVYFHIIREMFIEVSKETNFDFEIFAAQIKVIYLKFKKKNDDNQERIFEGMINWLNNKTGRVSFIACEIIICFFVQDCEVFS